MARVLYGHAVRCEAPLARAREGAAPRGAIAVDLVAPGDPALALPASGPVVDNGLLRVFRTGGRLVADCAAGGGVFAIDPPARRIATALDGAPDAWWEHRLSCMAIPLLLAERGDLALHACAVRVDGRAVVFCGPSMRGKSTLAWALARRGLEVLGEDGVAITLDGGPQAWPGPVGIRLRGTAAGGRQVVPTAGGTEPAPLAALVLLGERGGDAPHVAPVAPLDAVTSLMPMSVHAQGPSRAAAFASAAALARTVPVLHGRLPDDLERVAGHAERLAALALGAGAGTGA